MCWPPCFPWQKAHQVDTCTLARSTLKVLCFLLWGCAPNSSQIVFSSITCIYQKPFSFNGHFTGVRIFNLDLGWECWICAWASSENTWLLTKQNKTLMKWLWTVLRLRICGRTIDLIQTTTFIETNHWNIPPLDNKEADTT